MNNERGEGIISGLIAAGILGVVVLIVASLYQMASTAMIKSSTLREVDSLQKKVHQILSQKDLCEEAMPGLTWNGTSQVTIGSIAQRNGAAIAANMPINNGRLLINSIVLRPRDLNRDGVANDPNPPTRTAIDGVNHDTYPGEVVISFRLPPGSPSGVGLARPRIISVLMTVNTSTGQVTNCDINDESTVVAEGSPTPPSLLLTTIQCTPAQAIRDGDTSTTCTTLQYPECRIHAYPQLIDGSGEPKCRCYQTCGKPIWYHLRTTGLCVPANANTPPQRTCPTGAESGPPWARCSQSQIGHYCYLAQPGAAFGCGASFPLMSYSMVCI